MSVASAILQRHLSCQHIAGHSLTHTVWRSLCSCLLLSVLSCFLWIWSPSSQYPMRPILINLAVRYFAQLCPSLCYGYLAAFNVYRKPILRTSMWGRAPCCWLESLITWVYLVCYSRNVNDVELRLMYRSTGVPALWKSCIQGVKWRCTVATSDFICHVLSDYSFLLLPKRFQQQTEDCLKLHWILAPLHIAYYGWLSASFPRSWKRAASALFWPPMRSTGTKER